MMGGCEAVDKRVVTRRAFLVRISKTCDADTAEIELSVNSDCLTEFLETMHCASYHITVLKTHNIRL